MGLGAFDGYLPQKNDNCSVDDFAGLPEVTSFGTFLQMVYASEKKGLHLEDVLAWFLIESVPGDEREELVKQYLEFCMREDYHIEPPDDVDPADWPPRKNRQPSPAYFWIHRARWRSDEIAFNSGVKTAYDRLKAAAAEGILVGDLDDEQPAVKVAPVFYQPQSPHPGRPETFPDLLRYMHPFFKAKSRYGELTALIHFMAERQPGDNREDLVRNYVRLMTREDLVFEQDCVMLGEEYRKSFEGKVRPGSTEYWLRYVRRKAKQLVEQGQYKP